MDRVACIDQQVADDLVNLLWIGEDRRGLPARNELERDVLPEEASIHVDRRPGLLREIRGHRADQLLATEREQLLGEALRAAGCVQHLAEQLLLGFFELAAVEQLAAAADHREQVVEIVRHAACQPSDGLHLAGLHQLVLQAELLLLGLASTRDVAQHVELAVAADEADRGRAADFDRQHDAAGVPQFAFGRRRIGRLRRCPRNRLADEVHARAADQRSQRAVAVEERAVIRCAERQSVGAAFEQLAVLRLAFGKGAVGAVERSKLFCRLTPREQHFEQGLRAVREQPQAWRGPMVQRREERSLVGRERCDENAALDCVLRADWREQQRGGRFAAEGDAGRSTCVE